MKCLAGYDRVETLTHHIHTQIEEIKDRLDRMAAARVADRAGYANDVRGHASTLEQMAEDLESELTRLAEEQEAERWDGQG